MVRFGSSRHRDPPSLGGGARIARANGTRLMRRERSSCCSPLAKGGKGVRGGRGALRRGCKSWVVWGRAAPKTEVRAQVCERREGCAEARLKELGCVGPRRSQKKGRAQVCERREGAPKRGFGLNDVLLSSARCCGARCCGARRCSARRARTPPPPCVCARFAPLRRSPQGSPQATTPPRQSRGRSHHV